jgi:hypothetical protein
MERQSWLAARKSGIYEEKQQERKRNDKKEEKMMVNLLVSKGS